jgi:hypothetical protein
MSFRHDTSCSNLRMTRRHWLQRGATLGLGGVMGLGLPQLLRSRAKAATPQGNAATRGESRPRIKSCIVIFYYGGPSHLDTLDMKPEAPSEVRGEFKPISTSVPGISVCEHMPRLARVMHKVAVVRSMHHGNRLHDSASTETFTGRPPLGGDRENFAKTPQFFPCLGSMVSYSRRKEAIEVPFASLPWVFHNVIDVPCQGGGFLGSAYDPFLINGDAEKLSFEANLLRPLPGLTTGRVADRRALLKRVDEGLHPASSTNEIGRLRGYYEKAYDLLESVAVREAMDIEQEQAATRARYGMATSPPPEGNSTGAAIAAGRNLRGQNLLMARRLVEADVPFINVYDFKQQGQNWDAHADNFNQHKDHLLPPADQGLSALIEDLDQRGLLDTTLVVAMGEFGRTPKINGNAGRDHWPDCYSILLAGGGVHGGQVYGASDAMGAFPADSPVTPADLAATLFWAFGVDPASEMHDMNNRPYRLADGHPIHGLFS